MPSCSKCGTNNADSAVFCGKCGHSLSSKASASRAAALDGREYGSFWVRLVGFVIDFIIIGVVGLILGLLGGSASSLLGLVIGLGYYISFNAHGGTLGKRAVGLQLESDKTGEDIGYGSAVIRYIVAIASALVLFLGYFWVIWDEKNQTWHDKAAGSVVVKR